MSIGVEHEVIPGAATSEVVFAETRAEIEKLRGENPDIFVNAGEDLTAHSGEEYRQELRKALQDYGDRIRSMPWGAGSGFRNGKKKGHFFCVRVGGEKGKLFLRFVPSNDDPIVKDTLGCLRLIACNGSTALHLSDEMRNAAFDAWRKARRDIYDEWAFCTDPANLQPRVRPGLRETADHLRRYPPRGMTQDEIDRLVEAIEAPWGTRIERPIREAMKSAQGQAASEVIARVVRSLGL